MKYTLALLATMCAAPALAQDVSPWAELEYATEAEILETTVGVDLAINAFTITPALVVDDASGDFEFSSAEIEVAYSINENLQMHVRFESDEDFEHSESVLGATLRF